MYLRNIRDWELWMKKFYPLFFNWFLHRGSPSNRLSWDITSYETPCIFKRHIYRNAEFRFVNLNVRWEIPVTFNFMQILSAKKFYELNREIQLSQIANCFSLPFDTCNITIKKKKTNLIDIFASNFLFLLFDTFLIR